MSTPFIGNLELPHYLIQELSLWFIFVVGWHYRDCYRPGTDINSVNDYQEGILAAEKV